MTGGSNLVLAPWLLFWGRFGIMQQAINVISATVDNVTVFLFVCLFVCFVLFCFVLRKESNVTSVTIDNATGGFSVSFFLSFVLFLESQAILPV